MNIKDTTYDELMMMAAYKYLPFDWHIYKAQIFQESTFNPKAESPVGAAGLAQFMPATWKEVSSELASVIKDDVYDPESSLLAGAYYMDKMYNKWTSPRPDEDRIKLALASYNAGFGNILKAQKLSGDKNLYDDIIKFLPEVTGKHSKETIDYVDKIFAYYKELIV